MLLKKINLNLILVTLAIATGCTVFAYSRAVYYNVQFFWDDLFSTMHSFGEYCSAGVGKNTQNLPPEDLLNAPPALVPLKMPYKGAPVADKPQTGKGDYLYTRCVVDLSGLTKTNFGWMRLHFLHGDSAVFLNKTLRLTQGDLGSAEFPLLRNDRQKDAELIIVSIPNEMKTIKLGLPTGMPLIFTDGRSALSLPDVGSIFDFQLRPAYWINWSLALFLVFAVAWIGGLRREDIGWMVIALASNALMNLSIFSPENVFTPAAQITANITVFATHLALGFFVLSFLRFQPRRLSLSMLFLVITLAYAVALVYGKTLISSRFLAFYVPNLIPIGIYFFAVGWGYRQFGSISPGNKIRTRLVIGFSLFLGILKSIDLFLYYQVLFSPSEVMSEIGMTGFAFFLIFDLVISYRRYLTEKVRHLETKARSQEFEAIVNTTQMIAHDIRRPFSLAKNAIRIASETKDPGQAQALLKRAATEVEAAIAQSNSMLSEIIDTGRGGNLELADIGVNTLIDNALETVNIKKYGQIKVSTADSEHFKVRVEPQKIVRLIANIIENACQAIGNGKEAIEISCRPGVTPEFCEISIWNTGSFISPENLEQVFSPFYTRGKREGTGLGLAIARKVITQHGGSIRCDSAKSRGTGFIFTLPLSGGAPSEIRTEAEESTGKTVQTQGKLKEGLTGASQIGLLKEKYQIALIDDDVFIGDMWEAVHSKTHLTRFASPAEFLANTSADSFDIIFCDYYFEDGSNTTGADLAATIRKSHSKAIICLYSDAQLTAEEAGLFDVVIAKSEIPDVAKINALSGH